MANIGMALAAISAILVASVGQTLAEEFDRGKAEYQPSCGTCHGRDGKGNGPVSAQLKVPPPDLTVLAKKNTGVFPLNSVYETIDGRKSVIAHGTRDMPIWGDRYTPEANWVLIPRPFENILGLYVPETVVRMRILCAEVTPFAAVLLHFMRRRFFSLACCPMTRSGKRCFLRVFILDFI